MQRLLCLIVGAVGLFALVARGDIAGAPIPEKIDFSRDVRPILSDNCFHCHGPDKNQRKAGLRLDTRQGLFEPFNNKKPTVAPGKPDQSEFYKRLVTTEDDDRMPDPKSGKKLSTREIAVLKKWIEQGAPYRGHWSFENPSRPVPPAVEPQQAVRTPVDAFLLARLGEHKLGFSPEADRATLIRRLYLDLIGLPPTPPQVDAFINDPSPRAYENLVDSLLANPHFGERMAVYWLDLVRFADTIGYHSDNPRPVTPYRDWVISAFNSNMPFDQFTREQLAGDLLPNPTLQQRVAAGYNRLLKTTEEGGAQPKEYAVKYLSDRVHNVGSVWLGATLVCAECHDHKFDPYTARDFYSLAAFFADIKEPAVGKRGEGTPLIDDKMVAEVARLDIAIAEARKPLETATPALATEQEHWEKTRDRKKALSTKDKDALAAIAIEPAKRTPAQAKALATYFRTIAPSLEPARQTVAKLEKQKAGIVQPARKMLLTEPGPMAVVRVLPRGNWMNETGEVVTPAVPHFLPQLKTGDRRPTRLDLANWLVSRDNPLTARVFMNRIWRNFFGTGLSKTLEDSGSQGEWPTHPDLLDWLGCEFQDRGWDVKHMIRQIVNSAAYRQTSVASAKLREIDPFNRLIGRQGRFRIDAEFVRDNALSLAGLLNPAIGGESAKPYQPDGYWDFLNFPRRVYKHDSGAEQYRRGVYTWWQRTFSHPSLVNFDAPSREECTCERSRSNTPQQALTLLNDPTYIEASRVFATRVLSEGGTSVDDRLRWAWRMTTQRQPRAEELAILKELLARQQAKYQADAKSADLLLAIGETPVPKNLSPVELAAWTNVTRALLNLHETITRN